VAIVIEPLPNGPYLAKHLETLTNSKGDVLAAKDVIALCRCGCSTTKPFCSGMHKEVGFDSANLSEGSLNRRVDYEGDGITIHDNRGICAHSGFCTDNLREVWRLRQEPWIDPHGADAEEIAAVIQRCPSGALSYSMGGVELRDQDRAPAIFVSKNGPYFGRDRTGRRAMGRRRFARALHALPLRPVEEQALLRRLALGRRVQRPGELTFSRSSDSPARISVASVSALICSS
jgi:uncharacterized Fe-S cluster protein YjdI